MKTRTSTLIALGTTLAVFLFVGFFPIYAATCFPFRWDEKSTYLDFTNKTRSVFPSQEQQWHTFRERSMGISFEYKSPTWVLTLLSDNGKNTKDGVSQRVLGLVNQEEHAIIVLASFNNLGKLSVSSWVKKYDYQRTDITPSYQTKILGPYRYLIIKEITDEYMGTPNNIRAIIAINENVYLIEYASLSIDENFFENFLSRINFFPQNTFVPSSLKDTLVDSFADNNLELLPSKSDEIYGIQVSTCCGITDHEWNPFPCNTAQNHGNCTWWVRYRRTGNNIANLYACTGNANTWDDCAAQHYPTLIRNSPAQADAVVWTAPGDNHVTFIERMNGGTSYHFSQMDWYAPCPQRYYDSSRTNNRVFIRHPDKISPTCPAPPLSSPGDGETVHNRTVTFHWNAPNCSGLTGYTLHITRGAGPEDQILSGGDIAEGGTAHTFTFPSDGTFYWHVRAWQNHNTPGPWASRRIVIDTSAPPPSGQVELFRKANYEDKFWQGGLGRHDHISPESYSLKFPSGWSVKTRKSNGEERCWTESVRNLQDHGWQLSIVSLEAFDHNVCLPPSSDCPINADQVAMFEHDNFRGRCVVKGIGDYPNPAAMGFPNDTASSVKVGNNVKAILCKHDGFNDCETFEHDDNHLGDNHIGNDQVSSVKVERRSPSCSINADQVAIFEHDNFRGRCVVKGIGDYSNPAAMGFPNDTASSVKVGGHVKAILCKHDGFNDCETFEHDDPHLGDNHIGNDQLSSFRVQRRTQPPPAKPRMKSPRNGATISYNTEITLDWDPSSNATAYAAEYWGTDGHVHNSGHQGATEWRIGQLAPGTYYWHVEAYNQGGSQWSGWTDTWSFRVLPPPPSADFDARPLNGTAPLTVRFHIVSTDNISSCTWDYGDGHTGHSCDAYHDHTYTQAGTFTVRLQVTGSGGSDSKTRSNYISVSSIPATNTPTPTSTPTATPRANRAPRTPTQLRPVNGSVHTQMPELCWRNNGDPDGDPVQFWVDLMGAAYAQSGWITDTCWTPSVHQKGRYTWHVQAKDSHGKKSAYSPDWQFTLNDATKTPTPTVTPTRRPGVPTPTPTPTSTPTRSVGDLRFSGRVIDHNGHPLSSFSYIQVWGSNLSDGSNIERWLANLTTDRNGNFSWTAPANNRYRYYFLHPYPINNWSSYKVIAVIPGSRGEIWHEEWIRYPITRLGNGSYDGNVFTLSIDGRRATATPTPTATPSIPTDAWLGEYYDNPSLQGRPKLIRKDHDINFDWKDSNPAPGLPYDHFSIRWMRRVYFSGGRYTFTIGRDDGARLWIDDQLIFDEWVQGREERTVQKHIPAGEHLVRFEMYEHEGWAMAKLAWNVADSMPPSGDFTYPPPNAHVTSPVWLRVNAYDAESGIDYVKFTSNGTGRWREIARDGIPPYEVRWDMTGVPNDHPFMIGVEIYDKAGNRTDRIRWITRQDSASNDATPPSGDFTYPPPNAHVTSPVWLRVNAYDAESGIDYVKFTSNGTGRWREIARDGIPPYEVRWDMTGVPNNRPFMIGVEIYDKAGNRTDRIRWITKQNEDAEAPSNPYAPNNTSTIPDRHTITEPHEDSLWKSFISGEMPIQ